MGRSVRRTPIAGMTCAESEKGDKRIWHAAYRRRVREAVERGDEVMPHIRDVSNPWGMAKDGKRWWGRWLRNFPDRARSLLAK